MKTAILVIAAFAIGLCQVSLLAALSPGGVVPNVLLVVCLLAAAYLQASSAVVVALSGGLIADLASGSDFGLRMGVYGLITLAAIAISRAGVELHRRAILLTAVVLATAVFDLINIVGLVITAGPRVLAFGVIAQKIILCVVFNVAIALLLAPFARRLMGDRDAARASVSI